MGVSQSEMFPVTSSVLSAKALQEEVARAYLIGKVEDCRLIRRGLSDSYLVRTAETSYVLRVYRPSWRTISEILYEIDMLCYLSQHGAPVSEPLKRQDGSFLHGLNAPEGIRQVALFTYAQGEPPVPTEEQSYQMGRVTAQLHQAAEGFTSAHARFALDVDHLIHFPLHRAKPYLEHRPDDLTFLFTLADVLSKQLCDLAPSLDWGVCHGDATERNAHITPEGQVTFFDFDCGGLGWRAYDLATFRMNARKREQGTLLWRAYLRGYTATRPLSPADLEAEPLLFVARIFWSLGIFPATASDDLAEQLDDPFINRQLRFLRPWAAQQFPGHF